MALKVFKPITPGTRGRVDLRRDDLTADVLTSAGTT